MGTRRSGSTCEDPGIRTASSGRVPAAEQQDGLEISLAGRQPWCTGEVGIIGRSWGGFNGLQVAALAPPALKAIISVASTDDRYAEDMHFMGGCLLTGYAGVGGTVMLATTPPAGPGVCGRRWRDEWVARL